MQNISLADIKKQVDVLQIAERFFDSAVLFALFETDIFKFLASGPKTVQELQKSIGGNEASLRATLDAAVALKILSLEDGRYAASEAFLDCLAREQSPAYLGEWVAFLHAFATPLLQLGNAVKTGSVPGEQLGELSEDENQPKRMTVAMDAYARTRGVEIVDRLDLSRSRRLLDLGCGPGTYSMAIVERFPQVRATLLDSPTAISQARRLAAERNLSHRLEFVAIDARKYEPAEPFDTILVSNVLHMIGPEESVNLLKRCYRMMTPGGRMIVQAQYLNDDRVSPRWPTLLNLMQRIATPHGRNHAISETRDWLEQAGFRNVKHIRFSTWNVNSCIVGERPMSPESK
jgi:ubiquinone/menaquinone biosynthesis C-methylase UbiE